MLTLAGLNPAGAGATPASSSTATPSSTSAPAWMHVNADKKTASFDIFMAENGNNGTLNFNGYGHGEMTIEVPLGWKVHMHVTNTGEGTNPHSLEIMTPAEGVPQAAVQPAFPQAETIDLVPGMSVGKSDDVDFVADKEGKFWIMCGVPDHAVGGMWDWFIVSKSATLPLVTFTKQ